MPDVTTPRYGLTKPAVLDPAGADAWGPKLNGNFDIIDSSMGVIGFNTASSGDANAVIPAGTGYYYISANLTANRTLTLPAANSVKSGTTLMINDAQGRVVSPYLISVIPAGTDTLNGGTTSVASIINPYGSATFVSNGSNGWNVINWSSTGRPNVLNIPIITGGTIDNTAIGGTTPTVGKFTSLTATSVTFTGGAINGTPIGATTPSTGAFTTLSTTGTATFGGAVTANAGITSTGNISAVGLIASAGTNSGVYAYDRSGSGHYSIFYRNSDLTGIANSVGGGNMVTWDVNNNVSFPGAMTVTGTIASSATYNSGSSGVANTNTGFMVYDRASPYTAAALLYRSGTSGRLWLSDYGDVLSFNNAGGVGVAGALNVAAQANLNGQYVVAGALATNGTQLSTTGSVPLYLTSPNGNSAWITTVVTSLRAWDDGAYANGNYYIYDASGGWAAMIASFSNRQITLGGVTVYPGDAGVWGYSAIQLATSGGSSIPWAFGTWAGGTAGYISNYCRVDRTDCYLSDFVYGSTMVGSITTNGSSTSFNTTSDARLKSGVRPLASEIDVGALIDAIEPVAFEWENSPDHPTGHGFVAQDLHQIAPLAVSPGNDEPIIVNKRMFGEDAEMPAQPWGVDFSKLVPYLVAELQALRKRVAELEAQP